MHKLILTLTCPEAAEAGPWHVQLREHLAPGLLAAGASRVRINVPDETVAAGAGLRQSPDGHYPDAIVQIWLDDDVDDYGLGALIRPFSEQYDGWQVEERVPLANRSHPPRVGRRTEGWAQIALLVRPTGQSEADWREAWQGRHTAVAIETQSTFEYVQNRVRVPVTPGAPDYAAIVEECFPEAALTDPLTFFDAAGDVAKFKANLARMMASCEHFITPGTITVMPTSQFEFVRR